MLGEPDELDELRFLRDAVFRWFRIVSTHEQGSREAIDAERELMQVADALETNWQREQRAAFAGTIDELIAVLNEGRP